MKRFITYIYAYENGVRKKNTGFMKIDLKNNLWNLEIHLKNINHLREDAQIYAIVESYDSDDVTLHPIPLGTIALSHGHDHFRNTYPISNFEGSQYSFPAIVGIYLKVGENDALISCWKDNMNERLAHGNFETSEIRNHAEPLCPSCALSAEADVDDLTLSEEPDADVDDLTLSEEPDAENVSSPTAEDTVTAFEEPGSDSTSSKSIEYKKIDIMEIKNLPKKNWYLCNNSFLIHGFFNYHYLMLKKVSTEHQTKLYLGVPGIFERPEKMMALLFGFPEFEPVSQEGGSEAKDAPKDFGYWFCLLDT